MILDFPAKHDARGFWINLNRWTIPIDEVDASTPRSKVHHRFHAESRGCFQRSLPYLHADHPMGHGRDFSADAQAGLVPIPADTRTDPESDSSVPLW